MNEQKTIYALGFFDGVHLGHQALLQACRELAAEQNCQSGVVTFASHPDALVLGAAPTLLNTSDDRARLLYAYGVDIVQEIPFDKTVMNTHWADFLRSLMAAGAAGFVCGDDFRFGAGGLDTPKKLAAFCNKQKLPCAIVPSQLMEGQRISSTRIRELLEQGDLEAANRLLGHPQVFTGVVQKGKQLGRTIGFPTANLTFPEGVIVPKFGVYACNATFDGKVYAAVTNVGSRPTVNGEGITAEAHILGFDGDLYGKTVTLVFHKYLRPEQKFASLEELQAQIAADIEKLRQIP